MNYMNNYSKGGVYKMSVNKNNEWTGKPTEVGFYIIRGFAFDDLSEIAMVEVAVDITGEKVCNLHQRNSDQPNKFSFLLDSLSEDLEWLLLTDIKRSDVTHSVCVKEFE